MYNADTDYCAPGKWTLAALSTFWVVLVAAIVTLELGPPSPTLIALRCPHAALLVLPTLRPPLQRHVRVPISISCLHTPDFQTRVPVSSCVGSVYHTRYEPTSAGRLHRQLCCSLSSFSPPEIRVAHHAAPLVDETDVTADTTEILGYNLELAFESHVLAEPSALIPFVPFCTLFFEKAPGLRRFTSGSSHHQLPFILSLTSISGVIPKP
ncbi:hypothetical protein NLJ89_g827 [Agrocybe chaxingu]|uniref:Uncharacterized protein n=1 Tax=Agrocybe chaxingu TaxID=84603 RepID=A0A9W8TEB0_9AGAR|nr:hypothetical protein NLJ89_g827 [Agrocybe chaxingu]